MLLSGADLVQACSEARAGAEQQESACPQLVLAIAAAALGTPSAWPDLAGECALFCTWSPSAADQLQVVGLGGTAGQRLGRGAPAGVCRGAGHEHVLQFAVQLWRGCTDRAPTLCHHSPYSKQMYSTEMAKRVLQLTGGAMPLFAWRLPAEIASYKQARLPAEQWIHVIKGFAQKGIKQSEIEDSKVVAWLADQGRNQVAREELAEYVAYALPSIKEARFTGKDAKYQQYSWAGNGDYNESLFYFPTVSEDLTDRIADLDDAIAGLNFDFDALGRDPDAVFRLDRKREQLFDQQSQSGNGGQQMQTHFSASLQDMCPDARADFAHMRWSVLPLEGGRTLFIHELQSDWAQRGRMHDWSGPYKRAPLVTETEHWTNFLLRRAMALAVELECDQVSWINGAAMANGGVIPGSSGLDEYYMKIIPSLAKKLSRPFEAELVLKDIVLRQKDHRLAVMPVTSAMRERMVGLVPVYSYASVVENSTYDPVRAAQLRQALQLRANEDLAGTRMRVSIVREILEAHEGGRPVAALVGKVARIAFDAKDPIEALDHEAFHFAHRYHFTSSQRQDVARHFSSGSPLLVRTVRLLLSHGEHKAARQAMNSPEEAAAHAYALWRKGQMPLSRLEGLAMSAQATAGAQSILTKLFPAVSDYVTAVCRWIRGSAVSPTDFVAKIVRAHVSGRALAAQIMNDEPGTEDPWPDHVRDLGELSLDPITMK
jgi:hypothetical protein